MFLLAHTHASHPHACGGWWTPGRDQAVSRRRGSGRELECDARDGCAVTRMVRDACSYSWEGSLEVLRDEASGWAGAWASVRPPPPPHACSHTSRHTTARQNGALTSPLLAMTCLVPWTVRGT